MLIDAPVVRSVLVPALLTLLGNVSAWPRQLRGAEVAAAQPGPDPVPAGEREVLTNASTTGVVRGGAG